MRKKYVDWPNKFNAMWREMKEVEKVINQVIEAHPHEVERSNLYDPYEFLDDVTGQALVKTLTTAAKGSGDEVL